MRAVQGALIVASSIQIILGYSQIWAICSRYFLFPKLISKQKLATYYFYKSIKKSLSFYRFFSPLGMVPVIALVGFGLFDRGFPVVSLLANTSTALKLGVFFVLVFVIDSLIIPFSGWKVCGNWHPHAYPLCCLLPGVLELSPFYQQLIIISLANFYLLCCVDKYFFS